jgi:hypothetical protein
LIASLNTAWPKGYNLAGGIGSTGIAPSPAKRGEAPAMGGADADRAAGLDE